MSYILPQVQVFQEFRLLPSTVISNLNAFVFGPHYQLFRYGEAAEKALIGLGAYDKDNDTDYSYPSQPAGSSVDLSYVKLYMEDVWAEYISIPASDTNPINVVGPNELNKLRAAPVIGTPENSDADGVQMGADTEGWFVGGVDLPEYYYFYPSGGWDGVSAWSADGYKSDITTEDGVFAYQTSESLSGTVEVNATDNPLTAGVFTPGPDGLQFDLDAGTGSATTEMRSDTKIRIQDAAATSYFDLTVDLTKAKDIIDKQVDDGTPLQVTFTTGAGSNAVTFTIDASNFELVIDVAGVGAYDLDGLQAALSGDSDVANYFDISAVTGTGTNAVDDAVDELGSGSSIDGVTTDIMRDGKRIRITKNPYIFATGNGIDNSVQFKDRGVQVGDRIRWQVTDDSLVTHEGTSKIVGFEADQSLAAVADPTTKSTNGATQSATSTTGGLDIVVAGGDNQRVFDGLNTKVHSVDDATGGSIATLPADLAGGVLSDSWTVTITVPGPKGTAQATVENASGTYYREDVLIEDAGTDDGQLYLGNNLYINFDAGSGEDGEFKAGDTYTFSEDVDAAFTAVTSSYVTSGGEYVGLQDTTYIVEVIRGGVFDRVVDVINGLNYTSGTTLTPSIDWDDWTGGDNDDEYILKCITAGGISTAQFEVESLSGDNSPLVQFGAITTDVAIGGRGLVAQFSADGAFAVGDYWIIRVNASRPQVKISDSAGIDQGVLTVVNDADSFNIGDLGATLTFAANPNTEGGFAPNGGLLKGDVFYVPVTAAADGALRTLILSDDLPTAVTSGLDADGDSNPNPNNVSIWLYLVQSSAEIDGKKLQSPPDYNWEATEDEVTVYQDIAVQDTSWGDDYLPVYSADLFVEYRALMTSYTDSIYFISNIGDVEDTLGTIDPDNPLSQGVYNALSNSGDRGVYYMGVPTDDHGGYLDVLDKATLNDDVYGLVPLTQDAQVINSVEAHVDAMSTETSKQWRIAFVSAEMPTEHAIYNLASNPAEEEFYATITEDPTAAGEYTIVKFFDSAGDPSPYTDVLNDVVPGDKVRINFTTDAWGDGTYQTYVVDEGLTNTSLKLVAGPAAPVSLQVKVEVWHEYTVNEMATVVGDQSEAFANRRIYNVFPTVLGAFGVLQSGEFGAAAIAGLCSSVPPQQGLTNIELNGFDDLPMVYSTFNRNQLNSMAEKGTLIIMQDVAGGRIYVRHQVSTATGQGNILTRELSITKNLDSISYYFAGRLQPFIGRYNVTPDLLIVLRTQIEDGLLFLGSFTDIGLIGPQVILSGTEIRQLTEHPTLGDTVVATVDLQLPLPLNVIELHLVV